MGLSSLLFNMDCVAGAKKYLDDNSVDLIVCDPPYGIQGHLLHKHYNRNEDYVIDGYVEVPIEQYEEFSNAWINQAERVLKPGGSIYVVSGYTNLPHLLNALCHTSLREVNHIIWKYNFGVYTKNKYVSSHYHILFYVKPDAPHTFNTYARYSADARTANKHSLNYQDREDVWLINRKYKPGQVKNKNELPEELLVKIIQYSSNENELVCDFFLGGFSTVKVAKGLNRQIAGFEMNDTAFDARVRSVEELEPGYLLSKTQTPSQ